MPQGAARACRRAVAAQASGGPAGATSAAIGGRRTGSRRAGRPRPRPASRAARPAPRAGRGQGWLAAHQPGARLARASAAAARSPRRWPRSPAPTRRHDLGGGQQRVDHAASAARPAVATPAPTSRPRRITDELPAAVAVRPGGDQLLDPDQRGQRLHPRAAARPGWRSGPAPAPPPRSAGRRTSRSADPAAARSAPDVGLPGVDHGVGQHARTPPARCRPRTAPRQRPMPASAQADRTATARRPAGRCTGAAPPRRGWRRAAARPAGWSATGRSSAPASGRVCADHRQPRERLVGQLEPDRPIAVAGSPVVARLAAS